MAFTSAEKLINGRLLQVDRFQGRPNNAAMDMDPERLAAFAKRITEARKKYESRSDFAKAVGISRQTLRALERGQQQPSQETIDLFAKLLKVPAAVLTGQKRIEPDDPRLEHLNEEDLDVAEIFHHAPLPLKQRVLGVLQQRQPPRGGLKQVSSDVIASAQHLLALNADQRYAATAVITLLERAGGIDEATLALAQRLQRLPEDERDDMIAALEQQEQSVKKREQTGPKSIGPKPPRKS